VFFLPSVISFSARRCASLALAKVVDMDSLAMRDVTRFRRRARRCAESRLRCRCFMEDIVVRRSVKLELSGPQAR
jgi:hypothetical protein